MTGSTQVESVYQQLRARILDGALEQGYDLNERAVADLVGTSRTPVREAVARLLVDGLAERLGRRTRVTVWDGEKMGQLYEMRKILESEACRLAAMRRSENTVIQLEASLAEQSELENPSATLRRELNYRFHLIIWQASGNPFLIEANQKHGVQSMSITPTTLRTDQRWSASLDEHTRMVDHIRAHRAEEAADTMRDHIEAAFRQR